MNHWTSNSNSKCHQAINLTITSGPASYLTLWRTHFREEVIHFQEVVIRFREVAIHYQEVATLYPEVATLYLEEVTHFQEEVIHYPEAVTLFLEDQSLLATSEHSQLRATLLVVLDRQASHLNLEWTRCYKAVQLQIIAKVSCLKITRRKINLWMTMMIMMKTNWVRSSLLLHPISSNNRRNSCLLYLWSLKKRKKATGVGFVIPMMMAKMMVDSNSLGLPIIWWGRATIIVC